MTSEQRLERIESEQNDQRETLLEAIRIAAQGADTADRNASAIANNTTAIASLNTSID